MGWSKGFDPYASIWCKSCGIGNSIQGKRILSRTEYFDVDDPESPDSGTDQIEEDLVGEIHYTCLTCGSSSDDIDEIATVSQHEAHGAYIIYMNKREASSNLPEGSSEEEDLYYGEYYNEEETE